MKSSSLFLRLLVAASATVSYSCAPSDNPDEIQSPASREVAVSATAERAETFSEDTRAGWDGTQMVWHEGDCIGIFTPSDDNSRFVRSDTGSDPTAALFKGTLTAPAGEECDIYACYPYMPAAELNGGILQLNLPETQVYSPAGFSGLAMTAFARTVPDDMSLYFNNLYAVIALRLKAAPEIAGKLVLQKVIFEGRNGEMLSGPVALDPSSGDPVPDYSTASGPRIVLDCESAGPLTLDSEPVTVYMAVPPLTYSKGYGFTFVTNRGEIIRTARKAGAVHRRNVIYTVPELALPDPAAVIPDPNFRAALLANGYITEIDGEGRVELTEAGAKAAFLDVSSLNISSLKGIEYFTALQELYCPDNALTELDLSGNANLTRLDCSANQLTAVDLTGCPYLSELNCSRNALSTLDKCLPNAISNVNCSYNSISSLDISALPALNSLQCQSNALTEMKVAGHPTLNTLRCDANSLETLSVTDCPSLSRLYCKDNPLLELDISGNPQLSYLSADDKGNCIARTVLRVPAGAALQKFVADNSRVIPGTAYAWTSVVCESHPGIREIYLRNLSGLLSLTATDNPELTLIELSGSGNCSVTQSGNNAGITVVR